MIRKIVLLGVLMTAGSWLGCAGSDNQNYKILEDDRDMFNTEPDRRGGRGWSWPSLVQSAQAADAPATQPATASSTAPQSDTQPSLKGLDRSNWGKVVVTPADGRTTHQPIYFKDWDPNPIVGKPLRPEPKTYEAPANAEQAIATDTNDAFAGSGPNFDHRDNALNGVIQPVKFFVDVALLPYYLATQCPVKPVTTPE